MDEHHLVTGANGFLGRHLVRALLGRGARVSALVRAEDAAAARRRLLDVLGPRTPAERLRVIAGDLAGSFDRSAVLGGAPYDHVWHLAARLDLGRRRPVRLHEVNVAGTATMLDLCERAPPGRFHHVSTAYVCGAADGVVTEEAGRGPVVHNNVYESSKFRAEGLVNAAARRGLPASIYRPSIIVGDSRDGSASVYGAFYLVVRLCWLARELGPLVLPGRAETALDLVPVDRVTAALLALHARDDVVGHTFHLTNPSPPSVADLVAVGNSALGMQIRGIRDVPAADLPAPADALLRSTAAMLPYLRSGPRFDTTNVSTRLGADFLRVPSSPRTWLGQLMRHAHDHCFGLDDEQLRHERRVLLRLAASACSNALPGGVTP